MAFEDLKNVTGTVINIQHYSYEDGPGVRTTVFVKGCSLRCKWCANPESIHGDIELAFDPKDCIGAGKCGRCLEKPFPEGVFFVRAGAADDKVSIDWKRASGINPEMCELCPFDAIFKYGRKMTALEVIEEVDTDASFYSMNKGGITVSGGEPLLQPEFSSALLQLAHRHGYSTAIETAMNVPWENVKKVLPYVDTVLHDIKQMNPEQHEYWTGVSNKRILENLKKAYETYPNKDFIVRTPLIPGVNDSEEDVNAVLEFILQFPNVIRYELLPYHRLGLGKYDLVGRDYELKEFKSPPEEKVKHLRGIIAKRFRERDSKMWI